MMRAKWIALSLLLAFTVSLCFVFVGGDAAGAAGGTVVTSTWNPTAEAASTLTITDVGERGVGKVSYTKVPATTQYYEEQSQNAVVIDVQDYSTLNTSISIKYRTNIALGKILIFVHHGEGIVKGAPKAAGVTLIAFFDGWNTAGYTSKDGIAYRTINMFQSEYVGNCPITRIQISMESSDVELNFQEPHYLELYGIEFHPSNEKPVFVTDPLDPTAGSIVNDSANSPSNFFTIANVVGGQRITYNGPSNNKLYVPVSDWSVNYRSLAITMVPRENMKFTVYAGDLLLTDYNYTDSIIRTSGKVTLYYDIPESVTSLTFLRFGCDPIGDDYTPNTGQTQFTIESIVFNNSFRLGELLIPGRFNATTSGDDVTVEYVGESWDCIKIPVIAWNPTYDMFTIKVTAQKNTMLGIRLIDDVGNELGYLRNHYSSDSIFTDAGQFELFYFDVDLLVTQGKSLSAIELYLDSPTGTNPNVNEGETTFIIHSYEMKRSALMPSAEVFAEDLTVDYDGHPHPVTGTSNPEGQMATYYKPEGSPDTAFTLEVPVNGGVYVARVTFLGNSTYRMSYKDVILTINKVPAPTPDPSIVTINYIDATIEFNASLTEVSRTSDFSQLLSSGTPFIEGETLYARNKETQNYFTSEAIEINIPIRTDVSLSMSSGTFDYDGTVKTLTATSTPAGKPIVYYYKLASQDDGAYTTEAPRDAGTYTVKAMFEGTAQERTAIVTATLTINKVKAPTPTIADITINYATERFTYNSDLFAVSVTEQFESGDLIASNAKVPMGQTIYIKRKADNNYYESDIGAITMPSRSTATPQIGIDFKEELTSMAITGDIEYRTGTTGPWTAGDGDKLTLQPGTTYYFRYKATATSFASVEQELSVPKRPAKPPAVALEKATENSISVVHVEGREYKLGEDGEWQDSNVFEGLESNTEYKIFVRVKATGSSFASEETYDFLSTTAPSRRGCKSETEGIFGGMLTLAVISLLVFTLKKYKTAKK